MIKKASIMNKVSKSQFVEPKFISKCKIFRRQLSNFFIHTTIQNINLIILWFIAKILLASVKKFFKPRISSDNLIKLGIDRGGGFLKVCLGITEKCNNKYVTSPPRKLLLIQKILKESSVKRQILTAVFGNLSENCNTFRLLFDLA